MVRWTVHGIPRVPWEGNGRFDGTSEYKLDKHGKIYEHRVHNIALNAPPPKFRVLAVDELLQSIGCSSTPKPTYFEISPSPTCLIADIVPHFFDAKLEFDASYMHQEEEEYERAGSIHICHCFGLPVASSYDASKEFFEHLTVHRVEGRSSAKLPFLFFRSHVTAIF